MIDERVLPFAYLNGEIIPIEQASVPALDRGFLFGDAIYEVIPVYAGKLFRAQSHVDRLMSGLNKIGIEAKQTAQDWRVVFQQTAQANGAMDQYIYLQVTRGVSHFRDHATPADLTPLVFAMSQRLPPRTDQASQKGINAVLLPDTRWSRCDIKSTSLLANVLLRQSALEKDCVEAILHRDGWVTEGAASTVMLIIDDTLVVPPNNHEVLPGTTRRLAVELAETINVKCITRKFSVDELHGATEILISAATKEILPVCTVDQKPVGAGLPGPIWKQLDSAYQTYKAAVIADS
ncbi:MAG: aminotransferase class IV [Gammaproteobacteria bacterium]